MTATPPKAGRQFKATPSGRGGLLDSFTPSNATLASRQILRRDTEGRGGGLEGEGEKDCLGEGRGQDADSTKERRQERNCVGWRQILVETRSPMKEKVAKIRFGEESKKSLW